MILVKKKQWIFALNKNLLFLQPAIERGVLPGRSGGIGRRAGFKIQ
jgi:hypothetical protein